MDNKVYPKFYAPYNRKRLDEVKRSKYVDVTDPRDELKPYMNINTSWVVSEKLDGTNTRIIWDGYRLAVKGRTNSSQLQGYQNTLLKELSENGNYKFDETFGTKEVVIYGEAFGGKIQGNPHDVEPQFKVFDILVDGIWLQYEAVKDISLSLGLEMIPHYTIEGWETVMEDFFDLANGRQQSGEYFEGLVAVPAHMPLTRQGERVITKIKVADFEELNE